MMQSKIYHVVKKNIDGAYLLDKRDTHIYSSYSEQDARYVFNDKVSNKQCHEVYTLFIELPGTKYLHVLCER